MGMGKHGISKDTRVKGHHLVFFSSFPAPSLKHPAIQQNVIIFSGQKMHGAGDFPYRAVTCQVHFTNLL